MSMERDTQMKLTSGSVLLLTRMKEIDDVFEETGKLLKSDLGSRSGPRGKRLPGLGSGSGSGSGWKLLKIFDTIFEELGKRLKTELVLRSLSLGKRWKESGSGGEWLKELGPGSGSRSRGKLLKECDTLLEEIGKRLKSGLGSRLRSESRGKRLRPRLRSESRGKLLKEFDIVLEEIGKQLKSELGSPGKRLKKSESRGERLTEFDTVFEDRGKRLKSELGSGSGSPGKRLKESESRGERLKEFDTVFEDRGKRLKSELGSRFGSLKSEPKLKQKPDGDPVEIDYKNPIKAWEAVIASWTESTRHLSLWEADPASCFALCGGSEPFHITDDNRPTLITLSELALKFYYNLQNNDQVTSFVFHQLVKCSTATGCSRPGEVYYITFQARAEEENEDPSNSPGIKTFQTKVVWYGKNEAPEVHKCDIKI